MRHTKGKLFFWKKCLHHLASSCHIFGGSFGKYQGKDYTKTNNQTNKTEEPNHSTPKVSFVYFTVLVDLQGIQLFVCINDCIPLHIEPAALGFSTHLFCSCPWEVVSPTVPTVSVPELSYTYSKGQPDTYSCSLLSRQSKQLWARTKALMFNIPDLKTCRMFVTCTLYHGQMYWDSFTVLMLFLSSLESPVAQW